MSGFLTNWASKKLESGEGVMKLDKFMFLSGDVTVDTEEVPEGSVVEEHKLNHHIDERDAHMVLSTTKDFTLHPNDQKKVYEYKQPPVQITPKVDVTAVVVTDDNRVAIIFDEDLKAGLNHEMSMPIEIRI